MHSPVVPDAAALAEKLRSFVATGILAGAPERLWVNPDCGLKTRAWEEVVPSLRAMVEAAHALRAEALAGGVAAPAAGAKAGAVAAAGGQRACAGCC